MHEYYAVETLDGAVAVRAVRLPPVGTTVRQHVDQGVAAALQAQVAPFRETGQDLLRLVHREGGLQRSLDGRDAAEISQCQEQLLFPADHEGWWRIRIVDEPS